MASRGSVIPLFIDQIKAGSSITITDPTMTRFMKEVLDYYKPKIDASSALSHLSLAAGSYFLVSTHREENVDNPENLRKILTVLNRLAEQYSIPVIVSTHPRTRKRMELITDMVMDSRIVFMKPFGFLDYVHLQQHALCTISDSGTISEESAMLNFPAISIRQSMERPEAQDAGTIILSGFDPQVVLDSIALSVEEHRQGGYKTIAADYTIENTSWRVLKLIMGNAKLSNRWHGIKERE
jgi:UDP-N-acetylglucosamine 2-epimerase